MAFAPSPREAWPPVVSDTDSRGDVVIDTDGQYDETVGVKVLLLSCFETPPPPAFSCPKMIDLGMGRSEVSNRNRLMILAAPSRGSDSRLICGEQ